MEALERVRSDARDVVAGNEKVPSVRGEPDRNAPQVLGHALDRVRRLGALAARRARGRGRGRGRGRRGVNGAEQQEEQSAAEEATVARVRHRWQEEKKKKG